MKNNRRPAIHKGHLTVVEGSPYICVAFRLKCFNILLVKTSKVSIIDNRDQHIVTKNIDL